MAKKIYSGERLHANWMATITNQQKSKVQGPQTVNARKAADQTQDHGEVEHSVREEHPLPSSARTSGIPLEMP